MKIVEEPGEKLINVLKMNMKKERVACGEEGCMVSRNPKGGDCRKSEVVYRISCKECKGTYLGESSRNCHSRGQEHWRDYCSKNPNTLKNSVMWRHQVEKHEGEKVDFEMKVLHTFQRDPLGHQCMEAMLIKEEDQDNLINNKEEWNQPGDVRIEFSQYGIKGDKEKRGGRTEHLGGKELEKRTIEILKQRKENEKYNKEMMTEEGKRSMHCHLYTSPSKIDGILSSLPTSA